MAKQDNIMKYISLFCLLLILLLPTSCNENGNYNKSANKEPYINYEDSGFLRKYLDSEFQVVHYKSKAAYYREAYYSNGIINGDSITKDYYISGELQFVGHIVSENPDVLSGQGTWYYRNGQIETQYKVNSKGLIQGKVLSYYENGIKKSISNYSNGKLNGKYTTYFPNGNIQYDYQYKDDLTNGLCKEYFENGRLKISSNMIDGKQNGKGYEYYESGKLYATFYCVSGTLQGEAIEYYENGKMKSKGNYSNGSKNGIWKYYDTTGFMTYTNHSQRVIIPNGNYNTPRNSETPDDAYNNGYDEGYNQGLEDGRSGKSHGSGYDDSSNYYDYYETRYQEGYEEGYEEGYYEGKSRYEDEQEDEEDDW